MPGAARKMLLHKHPHGGNHVAPSHHWLRLRDKASPRHGIKPASKQHACVGGISAKYEDSRAALLHANSMARQIRALGFGQANLLQRSIIRLCTTSGAMRLHVMPPT